MNATSITWALPVQIIERSRRGRAKLKKSGARNSGFDLNGTERLIVRLQELLAKISDFPLFFLERLVVPTATVGDEGLEQGQERPEKHHVSKAGGAFSGAKHISEPQEGAAVDLEALPEHIRDAVLALVRAARC